MFAVYLIQNNITKEIYIGYTTDLKARLATHNSRGHKFTTRKNGEWKYVYVELYRDETDARVRENKLKGHGNAKHELLKRLEGSLL